MEEVDEEYKEAVDEVVSDIVNCLGEELQEILTKNRACWIKDWMCRRNQLGASSTILWELSEEDPLECKRIMRMSVGQFSELFNLIEHKISKTESTAVGQVVACTPVTQRARVRYPVGTSFLGEGFFQGFSSPVRQMSGSFRPPRSPNIIWPSL